MKKQAQVIFEKSVPGRRAYSLPACDVDERDVNDLIPQGFLRKEPAALPEVSEPDVMRHYVNLSQKNHSVDNGFYPLGSCTMKYNPKINEDAARLPGFAHAHPWSGEDAQGALELMYNLQRMLCEICGMDDFTLQPAAGAHGELTGLMLIKAWHDDRGDTKRTKILVPDTAHGTNPASAAMAGFDTVEIVSDKNGNVDIEGLKSRLGDDVAGLMLTNPSTLGLYEVNIGEIARLVHDAGGLLYYDGANANAIMGISSPGRMGFDVVHLNLHKTMATPHGGGGPGAGPVGVKDILRPFLPKPQVVKRGGKFALETPEKTIGKVRSYFGNFGVLARAYSYILSMGPDGLRAASEYAVLNANYLLARLGEFMKVAYDRVCMHEFVITGQPQKEKGCGTLDMAKRMLDFGVHPPTTYFPLIVKEALMIEPTETESKQTLDEFVEIMRQIVSEAESDPDMLHTAPHGTPVRRLDDVKAARSLRLVWRPED
jgi:glycine dehydrogenase subunit 2